MRLIAGGAVAALLAATSPARAQSCAPPNVIHTLPKNEAVDVPTDAVLSARYAANAEYLDEEVTLERVGSEPEPMPVVFNSAERTLSFTPPAGLEAGARYIVEWPKLRGLNSASRGRGRTVEFSVADGPDAEVPTFEGFRSIDWDLVRDQDDCVERQTDRFEFVLQLGDATDDAPVDQLAVVVFQTAGPGEVAPEPIEILPYPSKGKIRVRRNIGDALGDVCFAAIVRDLTDKASASGSREVCVKTIEPPFFDGCSVASHGRSRPWLWLFVGALGFARRRRRRD